MDLTGGAIPDAVLRSLPVDRYGVLGVAAELRTDSERLREFFSHAYRWFPPQADGAPLELTAILGPESASGPRVRAGSLEADLSRSPSPENHAFLFLLEALMDAIERFIVLHGGAVAMGSDGVILAGPAFAGKSTLVLELQRCGMDFLSDDAAPLDRSTGMLHPFPRAIGVRKRSGGAERPEAPARSLLELPHKWLLDPAAIGARLPASPRTPAFLFYLDTTGDRPAESPRERRIEIALAEEAPLLVDQLRALSRNGAAPVADRPFPTWSITLGGGDRPFASLDPIRRRWRRSILYIEEIRPPAHRVDGEPIIRQVRPSTLLLPLLGDTLNRGEGGKLLAAHGGRLTSLVAELGRLLGPVSCFNVVSGEPALTAAAISNLVTTRRSP